MPFSLASKSGEMLTSRDVRDGVPKYMTSVPKYILGLGQSFEASLLFEAYPDS